MRLVTRFCLLLALVVLLVPAGSTADPLDPFPQPDGGSYTWPGAVPLQVSVQPDAGFVRSRGKYSIDCPHACNRSFDKGTVITFDAVPNQGYVHVGWLVADHGGEPSSHPCPGVSACTVTLDRAKDVTAVFESARLYEILKQAAQEPFLAPPEKTDAFSTWPGATLVQISEVPWAVGTVRNHGTYYVDCPIACIRPFDLDRVVTFEAFPEPGVTFAGWLVAEHGGKPSYQECPGTGFCTLVIDQAKDVTAVFDGLPAGVKKQEDDSTPAPAPAPVIPL